LRDEDGCSVAAGCTIESMGAPAKAFSSEVGTGSREKTRRTKPPAGAGRAQWSTPRLNGQ
jgi:hypothetical protein